MRTTMPTLTPDTSVKQNNAEILLESGTNELEVLVFGMGNQVYGVNVAKVREVILPVEVSASPDQPTAVMGVFNLRNRVLPLVDLHHYFGIDPHDANPKNRRVIVTEFNGEHAAFQVENVEQIYRMSWTDVRPVPHIHSRSAVRRHRHHRNQRPPGADDRLRIGLRSYRDARQAAYRTTWKIHWASIAVIAAYS